MMAGMPEQLYSPKVKSLCKELFVTQSYIKKDYELQKVKSLAVIKRDCD